MDQNFDNDANNLEIVLDTLVKKNTPPISYFEASDICFMCQNKLKLRKRLCKHVSKMTAEALSKMPYAISGQRRYSEVFGVFSVDYFNNHVNDEFLLAESIKASSALSEIVDIDGSFARFITMATSIMLPIDIRMKFMDRDIGSIENAYRRVIYKSLKKYKTQIVDAINIMLLHTKFTGCVDVLNESFKVILPFLDIYGVRSYCFSKAKQALAAQDCLILKDSVDNYEFVMDYFRKKRDFFDHKIYSGVERRALRSMYGEYDISKVMNILERITAVKGESNDEIERKNALLSFVYYIYCKAGLIDKIVEIFKRFVRIKASANFVRDLYENSLRILVVLHFFTDERFAKELESYYISICDDVVLAKHITEWIDGSIRTENFCDVEVIGFISSIIQKSNNPESMFETLRVNLSNRLINKKAVVKNERFFLQFFKKMYSRNMLTMIEDAVNNNWMGLDEGESSSGGHKNGKSGCLLLTMCKWPEYKSEDVETYEPIQSHKKKIEEFLRGQGKRVAWLDVLSRASVEIFGRKIEVTLFQLKVLSMIAGGAGQYSSSSSIGNDRMPGHAKARITAENMSIPKVYQAQLKLLVDGGIIVAYNGLYKLSSNFKGESFIPDRYDQTGVSGGDEDSVDIGNSKAVLESKVMRLMKRNKKMCKEELLKSVPMGDAILADLAEKGYVEVIEDEILYKP